MFLEQLERVSGNVDVAIVVRRALLADAATREVWTLVPAFRAFLDGASESSNEARWLASMQFTTRQQTSTSSAEESAMFARIAELVGGAMVRDGDAAVLANAAPLLLVGSEVPLALYEAVKRVVDEFADREPLKSFLPMVRLLGQLERRVDALDFVGEKAGEARDSVRACVRGAMYKWVVKSYALLAERDVTLERGLETALLYVGVARQLDFFGGVPSLGANPAVAAIERAVDERLRGDDALRAKYASMPLRDLKRRLPRLLLTTPEFAMSSAAKLDGVVGDKRVKVILVGDSGVGKTQIRRRLGGEAFEAEHKSTDTAEVTNIEVTFLTIGEQAWTSTNTPGSAASAAGGAMLLATGQAPIIASIGAVPDEAAAESKDDRDAKSAAPGSDVSTAPAPTSAAPSAPLLQASRAEDQRISAPADNAQRPKMRPSGVDFDVADERKILSMWDFGGQSEYFAVHDLFLTDGAVFVLVVDWTAGVEAVRETVQVWLNALHAHFEEPVVLPVLTRCSIEKIVEVLMKRPHDGESDVTRKLRKNSQGLVDGLFAFIDRELVPGADERDATAPIAHLLRGNALAAMLHLRLLAVANALQMAVDREPIRVDSETDLNYEELKRTLLALADAQMEINGQVPLRWLQLHDELNRMRAEKHQWITRAEFDEQLRVLCGRAVSAEEAREALEYSKRAGTVLTCGGKRVSKYVFLDPGLFLELVRPLINTPEQLKKRKIGVNGNGALSKAFDDFAETCVVSRALLKHVWDGVASPDGEDQVGFFVELLEHCGLMCELEKGKYFVPAASKATPSAGRALDWLAGAEQIALVCTDEKIKALPQTLLPRIVASLFKGGAIMPPTKLCVVTQSDVVLQLRASTVVSVRLIRLQQGGNRIVLTLQRRASDDDVAARAWRLRAYTALYIAVESVLRLVFGSLSLSTKASVLCANCNVWLPVDVCSGCHAELASIDAWLPGDGDAIKLQRSDWTSVAPWTITVTAAAMRVVYFSASPQWKTPAKHSKLDKLDWKAEFEKVQRAADAIATAHVQLSFEFHDDGTLKKLKEVLESNDLRPTILVIACHGDPNSLMGAGALQFCDKNDRETAFAVDAAKLTAALRRSRRQLALTVFCSCHSTLLAPSIQDVTEVPSFVTFGADMLSVEHSTIFLRELLCELVGRPIGTPLSAVVKRAKKAVQDIATASDDGLRSFAGQIAWWAAMSNSD
jgi:GTPase SAR1 family protein